LKRWTFGTKLSFPLSRFLPKLELTLENTRGSIFMVLAMAAFAIEDMLIKSAAQTASTGLTLALFGLGGMTIFIILVKMNGQAIFHPALLTRPLIVRTICEITGRLFFILAITLTPLSSASAILQATTLVVVLGAAVVFREKVGLGRWIAVLFGFAGVLMIIRPGLEGFELASLFAVIGTLGFAGRDLATRAAPPVLSNFQLGVYGFFILIPTGLAYGAYAGEGIVIDATAGYYVTAASICGVVAYNALTIAMRTGEVSVVAPFRYTRLIFAVLLGVFVFGEQPDLMTIIGSAIVVISGGYTLVKRR
jgi:drug/metabolite transporter (DMT)-like permease